MLNDALAAMRRFIGAVDAEQIDYVVGGSIASIVYGKARMTRDADFILTLAAADVRRLATTLEHDFHVDAIALSRSVVEGDCCNVLDMETMFQIDLFTPHTSPWLAEQFTRRQLHKVGFGESAVSTYLASPEDVVLNKLHWYRLGNEASRMQWEDAVGVLKVQAGRLDEAYLAKWATSIGVADLLARARVNSN